MAGQTALTTGGLTYEPNVRGEQNATLIHPTVHVRGLQPGTLYSILRYVGTHSLPRAPPFSAPNCSNSVMADEDGTAVWVGGPPFMSDEAVYHFTTHAAATDSLPTSRERALPVSGKVGPMKGDDEVVNAATWWPPAIVVAPGASAIERQSAQLLATWCGKLHAWGHGNNCQHCPLPILTPDAAKGKPQFAVGVAATAALGLPASDLALDKLGVDGFVVTTNRTALLRASAGSVALSGAQNSTNIERAYAGGMQQGTLYAAYHLLRLLGIRFLAWDETLLPPSAPVLAQVEVDLTFVPHFEYRYTYGWAADYVPNPVPNADSPIHTQFHQSADPYVSPPGSVHTSYVLFGPDHPPGPNCTGNGCTPTGSHADGRDCCPPADLFRQHPEWFWPQDDGKSDGQLCWSNASMVSYITKAVDDMLAQEKDPTQYWVVSLSQVSITQPATDPQLQP